jgi:hypothetical protein
MLRVISFVIDAQLFCLKMEPKKDEEHWNLLVGLEIQITASESQCSSFTCWDYLSIEVKKKYSQIFGNV